MNVSLVYEFCIGEGDWIVAQAQHDEKSLWIALELRCNRVYHTLTNAILHKVDNLCILGGDASYILPHRITPACISHIFINHPEPPERTSGTGTNQGKHLLTSSFFHDMHRILTPTGLLSIVSDNLAYITELSVQVSQDERYHRFESAIFDTRTHPVFLESRVMDITVWRGDLPDESGVAIDASSYFDRMWTRGNKKRRWFMFLRKISEN
jgi:tRNA (guanine-N7-)-methyltransferase